ncbi:hypothetical protein LJC02_00005, partial [Breznakia sp. OttesenSCG-928-G09]|nr:hypothetical protein [Breznakia sp. OttesenSCG-928-G09]
MKNLKWKALCIVMCLCFAVFTAYAQKNINAYNYGNEEVFPIADGLASDDEGVYVNAAQLPNGKVVSVGYLSNDVLVSVFDPQTQTATRITLPEVISSGEAHSVIPLADNSYMIFGLGGNEVTKGLAAKIDSAGNVEVLAAPASQELKRVNYVYGDVLNDGSVIVAGIGTFTNDKKQPVVVKFNTDGTSQLLNLPELVMDGGHFSDVCALADGSFIAVGQRDSNSIPLIVKFSADGQGKVIPTPAEITNGEFMKLTKDANGNVVAVGEGRINEEAQQIAVKIKPDESVSVFEKPSNVTNYERVYFYHVMAQDDGSFLASGTAEINGVETGVVVRLSDEGSLLLNPQMDLSNGLFYATKALPDGTVVSVGTAYNSISGLSEPCVIQFDTNGNGKRIAMSAEIGMLVDVIALADGS